MSALTLTPKQAQELVDSAIAEERELTRAELFAVAAARRLDRPATETLEVGAWTVEIRDHDGKGELQTNVPGARYTVRVWLTGTEGKGDGGYPLAVRNVCGRRVYRTILGYERTDVFATREEALEAAREWVVANGAKLAKRYGR